MIDPIASTTNFIITTSPIIAVIVAFIFSVYKYFDNKNREQNQKEFEYFHQLIKDLVQPEESETMYLDRQTAIIFELRNFKRYHEYSLRMLKGFLNDEKRWKKYRYKEEIKLTISFIEKN